MVDGEVKLAYEDYLWHGDAKFSPTELVLHSPMVNYLFDEDDEEVVFVRQELDEAPPPGMRRADVRRREVIANGQFIVGYRVQNAG